MISLISKRKIWYSISGALVALSIVGLAVFGLKPSIDFTGGSILEVEYAAAPEKSFIETTLIEQGIENAEVRRTGENGYIIKSATLTDGEKNELVSQLALETITPDIVRFNTIGPTLGQELKTKAVVALLVVIVVIVLFIAYTFRAVSTPVSSMKYGYVAIIALVHDVLITLGIFSFLGYFAGIEVDTLFITALLVILGYSINDTIVVLDRVRENLREKEEKARSQNFEKIVNKSLNETLARSINTSITTLLALGALFVFGGEATRIFTLALIIGVISGVYSSIFLAAPMLVSFKKYQDKHPKPVKVEKEAL